MWIYAFGSLTSGDVDSGSDADILVVLEHAEASETGFPESWSIYSLARLTEIYEQGTLFAWHLHTESVLLYPRLGRSVLGAMQPAPYTKGAWEVGHLHTLAGNAVEQLTAGTVSRIFELGLVYLAARDTAMAAMPVLSGKFDFSRYAPLRLPGHPFPVSRSLYHSMMACRRSSTRGALPPTDVDLEALDVSTISSVLHWLQRVKEACDNASVSG